MKFKNYKYVHKQSALKTREKTKLGLLSQDRFDQSFSIESRL